VTSNVARLRWYVARARVMTVPEIVHRVQERGRQLTYKRRPPYVKAPPLQATAPVLLRPLLLSLAGITGALEYWEASADRLLRGQVQLLGQTWVADPLPDWRLDPVTGRRWPDTYAFEIDYRHAAHDLGEVKYVWELNRLLYLLPVAASAAQRQDSELLALVRRHVEDWLSQNPPYRGVAWASGIEVALRIVALVTVDEVGQALQPDAPFSGRVWQGVAEHADWLERFPSRFSSANNHRVAELVGLLIASLKGAHAGRAGLVENLVAELSEVAERQYYPDGVGAEQSTSYATSTMEWLGLASCALSAAGQPPASELQQLIERAQFALDVFTDAAGNVVRVGDDDETRILTAAVPHDRYLDAVRLLTSGRSSPAKAVVGLTVLEHGGYSVARHHEAGTEALWVLDHGPLGFGEIAAHGHADTLSVWLHLGGAPVFVDAGTYLYHSGDAWREYMRSTHAHNTLVLEDLSSSITAGSFNWHHDRRAQGRLVDARDGENWSVEAEHDGYVPALGLVHRRSLARLQPGHWQLKDAVEGQRAARATWSLVVAPDIDVRDVVDGWVLARDGRKLLHVAPAGGWTATRYRGSETPRAGWYSGRFGSLVPTNQLVLSGTLRPTEELVVDFRLLR